MSNSTARISPPDQAAGFDANSRAFHAALTKDRDSAVAAAKRLADSAHALSNSLAAHNFSRAESLAVMQNLLVMVRRHKVADRAAQH